MASSAYYKKLNAQQGLAVYQVQPLLEQLTCELSLSRPSDPIAAMLGRLSELEAALERQPQPEVSGSAEDGAEAAVPSTSVPAIQKVRFNVRTPRMILTFLGGPGSGKTVQTSMAAGAGGLVLAPVELIEEAINGGRSKRRPVQMPAALRDRVLGLVRRGQLVPTEVMTELFVNRVLQAEAAEEDARASNESGKHIPRTTFLLDGYPRCIEQALALEKALGEVSRAVQLYCPTSVERERMTGTKISEEDQQSRLRYYKAATIPLLEYWKAKKKLVVVDGTQERNACSKNIQNLLRD